jgi:hypothetical protein
MNDTPRRERRSPVVVLLDAAFGLAAALQTGQLPGRRRVREEGEPRVSRRAGIAWLTAGIVAAVAGTVLLAVTLVRTPDGLASLPPNVPQPLPPASAPEVPTPAVSPSSTPSSRTPSPSPSVSPTRTPAAGSRPASAPPVVPAAVPLTARYAPDRGGSGLLGYRSTVTIANPARSAKTGWVLTVTLPRSTLTIDQVSGATVTQDGSTWTFVPDESTRRIPPAATVAVSFTVRGATLLDATPKDCQIDGNACTGLQK